MGAFDGLILGSVVLDTILMLITHFVLTKKESEGDIRSKKRIEYELVTCISIVLITLGVMVTIANIFHWESDLFDIHPQQVDISQRASADVINNIHDNHGTVNIFVGEPNGDSAPYPTPTPTKTSSPTPIVTPKPEPYTFVDPAVEKVIRTILGKAKDDSIFVYELESITEIPEELGSGKDIHRLDDFAMCKNLTVLFLDNNRISDLRPLSKLTKLWRLWVKGNSIIDITPLADITSLTNLGLNHNQISDLSPLRNLENLESLYIYNNKGIVSLEALDNLERLSHFQCGKNSLSKSELSRFRKLHPNCNVD